MKIFYLLFCLAFLTTPSMATFVAVLETAADGHAKDKVSFSDRQYLTNVLRGQAVKVLPASQNYTIMTRENIMQMLPPGKSIEDCEGSCIVETGKNIAADYVSQARVGLFGNWITLSVELYETAGNKLVASFNGRGTDVEALLDLIKQRSPGFFSSIKNVRNVAVVEEKVASTNENVAPSVPENALSEEEAQAYEKALHRHAHRGFYFSSSLTFGYTYLRQVRTSLTTYGSENVEYKFEGISSPYAELRLGGSIANRVSIYGMLGVGFAMGDFDYENTRSYNSSSYDVKLNSDATSFKFALGGGLEFYPFKDEQSLLYGLFLGLAGGYSFDIAYFERDESSSYNGDYQEGFINLFVRFEAGKDWWFNDRWSVGFALNYTIGKAEVLDDDAPTTNYNKSYAIHAVGLTFRVSH